MVSRAFSVSQQIELDSINKDAHFYLTLGKKLHSRASSGVLFPNLIPYYSLFTIESHRYLQKMYPKFALALSNQFQPIINASRMRTKFFDDNQNRVDGTFELFDWIADFHHKWHIGAHKGWLASIKRTLQDDLGVFFYQGHVISSTHTGIFNLGYSKEELPTTSERISSGIGVLSFSVGESIGKYIAGIIDFLEFLPAPEELNCIEYNLEDDLFGYIDIKSHKFLNSIFNGSGSEAINLSLLLFLTQINILKYILSNLVIGRTYTLFKLKYLVLYHLASSLQKILSYFYQEQIFNNQSLEYLKAIVKDKDLKEIASKSNFRNILVHYEIRNVKEGVLNYDTKLYGLIEYFFDGRTYDEIDNITDKQIDRISLILEDWLDWRINQSQIRKL